jgi:hypothetical protein
VSCSPSEFIPSAASDPAPTGAGGGTEGFSACDSVRFANRKASDANLAELVIKVIPVHREGAKPHKFNVFCHRGEAAKQVGGLSIWRLFALVRIMQKEGAR